MTKMELVFVYGSLKRGGFNHPLLATSRFIGLWKTTELFTMYSLGPFPVVCLDGNVAVSGEIFQVNAEMFQRLDKLEGYPDWYQRQPVVTRYGRAWIYYMTSVPAGSPVVTSGDWEVGAEEAQAPSGTSLIEGTV